MGEVGHIDDDLVHRDASEEGTKGAVDEDLRASSGEVAWVAIAVTECEDGGFGIADEEGASVGNAVSFGEMGDDGDAGFERHYGDEFGLVGREG